MRRGVTIAIRLGGFVAAVVLLPFVLSSVQSYIWANWSVVQAPWPVYVEYVTRLWPIAVFLLALYCFLSGRFVIDRIMRGLEGRCPKCNYDLAGVRANKCPECGEDLT